MSDDPTRCARCGEPKNRAAKHAKYCAPCAVASYREKRQSRWQAQGHGTREQFDRVMQLWRDGTLIRVLKQVDG